MYQSAQQTFPDAEVYVAATNDTSSRPFPFAVKEKLARLAGVDTGHFVQVKSPFRAEEITAKFDPQKDVLIFVRSEKDAAQPPQPGGVKKDGSPSYLQPLLGARKLEPFAKHAYMAYLPTVEFGPGMTSATEIRSAWPRLNEKRKTALVMSLYPKTQTNPKLAQTVVKLLDTALGVVDESALDNLPRPNKRNQFKSLHKQRKQRGLDEQGVAEGVPQPGKSSGKPISWIDPTKVVTEYLTLDEIFKSVSGIPYYNNVVTDRDNKDFTWGVTKRVIQYAKELVIRPDAYKNWPPIIVLDGKLQDGAHRISTIYLMQQRVQPNNPIWKNAKLKVEFGTSDNVKQGVAEGNDDIWGPQGNFAGDIKIDVGTASMKKIQAGDTVKYFGETAQVIELDPDKNYARISANGKTLNVRLSDLKQLGRGVGENQGWAATFTNEDDYIEEKWSSKYKNSINCAAPRGFSQRAHCAGRKK